MRQTGPRCGRFFQDVIRGGDTYVFAPDTPEPDGLAYWFGPAIRSFAATDRTGVESAVIGMFKIVPNYRDLGSHVSNASFMVSPRAQGQGVGRAMGLAALAEARKLGVKAMQFNFVVSTNEPAVKLWRSLDFEAVGTLPKAYRHRTLGFVDAYVMYRYLES
jgi:GNAT superfamily N-acetyltransferase